MFHRVKSEVQDTEQNTQADEQRDSAERQNQDAQAQVSSREENESPRAYGRNSVNQQQEERNMSTKLDTAVQGKYAAESEEQAASQARPSYQQPSSRPSANYTSGSSYSSPSYSNNAPADNAYPSAAGDRTLTIGRGINMSGEIECCDHLMVEGTVEAALKGAKLLEIAVSGTFYGTVEIEEAVIAGRFEGDITVSGRLTLKSGAIITGSIAYRELEVEAGAVIDGRMTPLKATVDPKSADNYRKGTEASAMAKAKEIVSKKDNREPANTENALFSKAHASY